MDYVTPLDETAGTPYADRNLVSGVPGSRVSAAFFNTVLAELIALIEGAGLTLSAGDLTQVLQAVVALGNRAATVQELSIASAEVDFDITTYKVFTLDVDENFTLNLPTVPAGIGGMFLIFATQDATGRSLFLESGYEVAAGAWSTDADAVNIIWGSVDASGTIDLVFAQRGAA